MKGANTIARVRREFPQRERLLKEVARELHISRNTLRKVLLSDATMFHYERGRLPLPEIGPWKRVSGRTPDNRGGGRFMASDRDGLAIDLERPFQEVLGDLVSLG